MSDYAVTNVVAQILEVGAVCGSVDARVKVARSIDFTVLAGVGFLVGHITLANVVAQILEVGAVERLILARCEIAGSVNLTVFTSVGLFVSNEAGTGVVVERSSIFAV